MDNTAQPQGTPELPNLSTPALRAPVCFLSCYDRQLERGRVTLPVQWREIIQPFGNELAVVLKNNKSLGFARLQDQAMLALHGQPQIIGIDEAGRVALPVELREGAGLVKDLRFWGLLETFELWDRAAAQRESERLDRELDANWVRQICL